MNDQAAQEILKEFILSRIEEVYIKLVYQPKVWYKGIILWQFMDLLINNYQATLEEWADVKRPIKAPWDPNQHIKALFDRLGAHLQTLVEIKKAVPYSLKKFLESRCMAICQSKQFKKACEIWKRKPAGDWATKAQFQAYFKEKYEMYDVEQDLLHDIGVANNAEI